MEDIISMIIGHEQYNKIFFINYRYGIPLQQNITVKINTEIIIDFRQQKSYSSLTTGPSTKPTDPNVAINILKN